MEAQTVTDKYYSIAELLHEIGIPLYEKSILLKTNASLHQKRIAIQRLLLQEDAPQERAEKKRKILDEKNLGDISKRLDNGSNIAFINSCMQEYAKMNNAHNLFQANESEISSFLQQLQPVHSCSLETFKKILKDGRLRSSFNLKGGNNSDLALDDRIDYYLFPSDTLRNKIRELLKRDPKRPCQFEY